MQASSKMRQFALSIVGISALSLTFMPTAEAKEVRSFCKSDESTFVAAETKNFWVSICGGHSPISYVGVNKKTGKAVRLPLKVNGAERGTYYEAVNGKFTYILADSTKGKNLTVAKGTREILREPVLRGWNY